MKLINKQTGEIGYLRTINWNETALIIMDKNGVQLAKYNSLVELNAEWEDYEEPKDYWYIYADGWNGTKIGSNISYISEFYYEGCTDDMDLLFGGEE